MEEETTVGKFRKYEKIHRYGKEETDGILDGTCYIQEKVDGANTSIFLDEHGEIKLASRNQTIGTEWRGFPEYVNNHRGIVECLIDKPTWRLYGEWLVKHTINYNVESYNKFYLFDIHDGNEFIGVEKVYDVADKLHELSNI